MTHLLICLMSHFLELVLVDTAIMVKLADIGKNYYIYIRI